MGHMSHHDFCYLYRSYRIGFNSFAFKTILYKERKQYKLILWNSNSNSNSQELRGGGGGGGGVIYRYN